MIWPVDASTMIAALASILASACAGKFRLRIIRIIEIKNSNCFFKISHQELMYFEDEQRVKNHAILCLFDFGNNSNCY